MRYQIAPISNVLKVQDATDQLLSRSLGMPGMGLISGPTGYGKTTAATWLINQVNGVYVRAIALTTPSVILESICLELDIPRRRGCAAMISDIVQELTQTGRPLFIDEADYLVTKRALIDTLRDIHDLSTMPVILIGEESMHTKLKTNPRLTRRMAEHVKFEPASLADAHVLSKRLAEVEINADLIAKLAQNAGGSVGLLVVGIEKIEKAAKLAGMQHIALADWPSTESFFVGVPPKLEGATANKTKVTKLNRE